MTIHPLDMLVAMAMLSVSVSAADDPKPAPAAVRAKAVIIKKAAAPAAEAKRAEKAEAAKAAAKKIKEDATAPAAAANDKPVTQKKPKPNPREQLAEDKAAAAAKVAPANLKGFGKNEADRKPAAAPVAVAAPVQVMNAAVPGLNDDQMKQIKEQYKQQLQPILVSELAFIRMTCDIPKDKRPGILKAGRAIVEEAAQKIAEQQNRNRGGVRIAVQANNVANDPPKAIRVGLDAALKEVLTEEQLKVYRDEAAHRKEQIKQAAIYSVVARLDGALCLTAESRDKIAETISGNWQESYERWLQIHQYGDQYFPSVPDQLISVHLNDEQKQIWNGLQKIGIGGWGNFGGQVGVADDGWWGEAVAPGNADANGVIFFGGGVDVDF